MGESQDLQLTLSDTNDKNQNNPEKSRKKVNTQEKEQIQGAVVGPEAPNFKDQQNVQQQLHHHPMMAIIYVMLAQEAENEVEAGINVRARRNG